MQLMTAGEQARTWTGFATQTQRSALLFAGQVVISSEMVKNVTRTFLVGVQVNVISEDASFRRNNTGVAKQIGIVQEMVHWETRARTGFATQKRTNAPVDLAGQLVNA